MQAANQGFPEFCVAVDPKYSLEWFHQEIALRLERAVKQVEAGEDVRLMIFMPPRHGKSDQATQKFPSWVLGHHPDWPFIIASYSSELATDFGQGTRDLMNRPSYAFIFDTRLREDTTAKAKWMTQEGGGYTAVGVGGAITGRGFKIGIVDDPFKNREEADSPVTRESVHKWWRSTFYTRQEGNSLIVLILTRWHDDDLAGRLLREQREAEKNGETDYDHWEVLEYKALAERDELHRKVGEALWPDKFSVSKLNITRAALGSYEWSALYQQNPIDEDSQEFKKSWLQYRTMEDVLKMKTRKFATIDPAGSRHKDSDYTGVTRNWVNDDNEWNIKSTRYRVNSKGIVDLIFTLHEEGFEDIGIEEGVFTDAIEPFLREEMDKRKIYPRITPLKHRGIMKETRIRGLIPRYENRKVYHIENSCTDLEEEYLRFPKAAHDDCLDTTAYQNQIAAPPSAGVGDVVNVGDFKRCLSTTVNSQDGVILIGVSTALPVHYVIGNKEGLFFYAATATPKKDILEHLRDFKPCYVFADRVGDSLWLDELKEEHKGKIIVCHLKNDPDSQSVIKWGEGDKYGELDIGRSSMIQSVLNEVRDGRFVLNGTSDDWKEYIAEFLTLYRRWDVTPAGAKVGVWESGSPEGFIKSTIFFRAGISKFAQRMATVTEDHNVWVGVKTGMTASGTVRGAAVIPQGYTPQDVRDYRIEI